MRWDSFKDNFSYFKMVPRSILILWVIFLYFSFFLPPFISFPLHHIFPVVNILYFALNTGLLKVRVRVIALYYKIKSLFGIPETLQLNPVCLKQNIFSYEITHLYQWTFGFSFMIFVSGLLSIQQSKVDNWGSSFFFFSPQASVNISQDLLVFLPN